MTLLALLHVQCRKRDDAASGSVHATREPARTPASAAVAFGSRSSPSSSASTPSSPPPPAPDLAPFERKLQQARQLVVAQDFDRARARFAEATGSGQLVYLPAVVEGAYVELQNGNTDPGLEIAFRAGTADRNVAPQAWYNLALLYEKLGRSDGARAALAHSLALKDNAAVAKKLGSQSRCLAEIGAEPGLVPEIASDWAGVCRALQKCNSGDVVSEHEARARSCLECSMAANIPDPSNGCPGNGPWESTFDYLQFSWGSAWIAPIAPNGFFVSQRRVGAWPAICRGSATVQWEHEGAYAVARIEQDDMAEITGRSTPMADPANGVCLEATTHLLAVYSANTAKLLASVGIAEGVSAKVDVVHQRIELSGGACDGTIALDGSTQWLPHRP